MASPTPTQAAGNTLISDEGIIYQIVTTDDGSSNVDTRNQSYLQPNSGIEQVLEQVKNLYAIQSIVINNQETIIE